MHRTPRPAAPLALGFRTAFVALVAGTVGACSARSDDRAAGDSATAPTSTAAAASPAAADTGMAGMDHSQMAGMDRSAPKDSNQAFLRMMSDHHEGLVALADSAQPRLQSAAAKADARELRQKQDAEQQRMLTMLSRQYQDSVTPMVMPSNRTMIDSVRQTQGAAADPTFYRQVIAHHREAVQMVGQHGPHLTGEVKQMAERMRTEQQREIQEFERKATAGPS